MSSHVHREFPRKFESCNLRKKNLSREIGRPSRRGGRGWAERLRGRKMALKIRVPIRARSWNLKISLATRATKRVSRTTRSLVKSHLPVSEHRRWREGERAGGRMQNRGHTAIWVTGSSGKAPYRETRVFAGREKQPQSGAFRHCKPAACILGLTGANTRLSLTCGFPRLGQDICDMFPAWDPPEGISFSNEFLWKIRCVLFLGILYVSKKFIWKGDPLREISCRKHFAKLLHDWWSGRHAALGLPASCFRTQVFDNRCCRWSSLKATMTWGFGSATSRDKYKDMNDITIWNDDKGLDDGKLWWKVERTWSTKRKVAPSEPAERFEDGFWSSTFVEPAALAGLGGRWPGKLGFGLSSGEFRDDVY